MASGCRAAYGSCAYTDVLGASRLDSDGKNYLYGGYLLYLSIGLYLRKYPLRYAVRRDDAEHRRAGEN